LTLFRGALGEASRASIARDEADGMGTTITGLAGLDSAGGTSHLMVFNVGDSRVYRMADDRLDQVTVDHSEVNELVNALTELAEAVYTDGFASAATGAQQPAAAVLVVVREQGIRSVRVAPGSATAGDPGPTAFTSVAEAAAWLVA
jgi:serine/threonine protein phosphatase PrpC